MVQRGNSTLGDALILFAVHCVRWALFPKEDIFQPEVATDLLYFFERISFIVIVLGRSRCLSNSGQSCFPKGSVQGARDRLAQRDLTTKTEVMLSLIRLECYFGLTAGHRFYSFAKTEVQMSETREFQTETRQLLDLMIHSIYSSKEIFLRELISNASDAIDKLRYEAISNSNLLSDGGDFEITLEADSAARTLTISDNGIGMSHDEVVSHIGTIAKSGTREVLNKMKEAKSEGTVNELIGQFGVGFYSSFIVAEKVVLTTRRADSDKAVLWESTGDGTYTIGETTKEGRGTTITLHLKPADSENGLNDFTNNWEVERIVKKYSDFISYPIKLKEEKTEKEKDAEGNEIEGGKETTTIEWRTLNSMKPIWTRSKSDVKEEEYKEFYHHISHDWNSPLETILYNAEGRIQYTALLFIPEKAPFDFYYQSYKIGLHLYVKKILVDEALEDLLPHYLRFVKGIVDSPDLPLNISREMLQVDRQITAIRKGITSKILSTLKTMLEKDRDKYIAFYKEFGPAIKEGAGNDYENKDKLENLLLFSSSNDAEKLTTLKEYVERMHPGQKEIYFITGESRAMIENSPHMEAVREKGYEVLYLLDPVEELVLQQLATFDEKPFKGLGKGELDLDADADEESKKKKEEERKEKAKTYEDMFKTLKDKLSETIREVKLSSHLKSAPAAIIRDEFEMSPHLKRILSRAGEDVTKTKYTLELNADHEIVKGLKTKFDANHEDPAVTETAEILLGYALIAAGAEIANPISFNDKLLKLLSKA